MQQEESDRITANLEQLTSVLAKKKKDTPRAKTPSLPLLDDLLADHKEREPEPAAQELGRLAGLCAWDIFSDNHDVLLPDGRAAHLGSFRGSAGEIAEFFYNKPPAPPPDLSQMKTEADFMAYMRANMDYMEFYMGTQMIAHRTSLRPVYRLIFQRLKEKGCDWKYSFPRLGMVRLAKPEKKRKTDWEGYDPSAAIAAGQEEQEKEAELARMEESLDEAYRASVEEAKYRPPPETVYAYREVFGHDPAGWPPWEYLEDG